MMIEKNKYELTWPKKAKYMVNMNRLTHGECSVCWVNVSSIGIMPYFPYYIMWSVINRPYDIHMGCQDCIKIDRVLYKEFQKEATILYKLERL